MDGAGEAGEGYRGAPGGNQEHSQNGPGRGPAGYLPRLPGDLEAPGAEDLPGGPVRQGPPRPEPGPLLQGQQLPSLQNRD